VQWAWPAKTPRDTHAKPRRSITPEAVDNEIHSHLDPGKFERIQKRKQAKTASDTHTESAANSIADSTAKNAITPGKKPLSKEEKKTAGAYIPYWDHMTILSWNVMGSTTIPDELREIADQKKAMGHCDDRNQADQRETR